MGVSTDAILFYGLCWDKENCSQPWLIGSEDEWAEDEQSWQERFTARVGKPRADAYTFTKKCPVEVGVHCSQECEMPYVAVRASITLARRGFPEFVKPLDVGAEWIAQLRHFCEIMAIPWQEPKWWLVSNWS